MIAAEHLQSEIARPSVDPELMSWMLLVGYCYFTALMMVTLYQFVILRCSNGAGFPSIRRRLEPSCSPSANPRPPTRSPKREAGGNRPMNPLFSSRTSGLTWRATCPNSFLHANFLRTSGLDAKESDSNSGDKSRCCEQ